MTHRSLYLLLALATAAAANDEPTPEPGAADRAFAGAIEACRAASHQAPHPFMKGFTIEHVVAGEQDGACAYSQTMPGGMRMECRLSKEGRAGLAAEFLALAEGHMSGSTSAQPAWTSECEILTKDGKRLPMGKG